MNAIKIHPVYRFLAVMTIAEMVGFQAWRTLFNNFAVEIAHLEGSHMGMIQAVREIPGFLALLAVYFLLVIKEHRLSALSIVVTGLGVAATGFFPNYAGLLITTLVMSAGFHYYETTNMSMTLQYFDKKQAPLVFGSFRRLGAGANIVVGLLVYVIAHWLDYTAMYLLFGLAVTGAGLWGLSRNPVDGSGPRQRKEMIFRWRYWLFYLLTFMAGARRQIFIAFAVFLMVKIFDYSVREITVLFVINNIVNYFVAPLVGKAIVRFGERKVMTVEYIALIIIFLSYTVVQSRLLVAILYILDHMFFNCTMAINTFFQKTGDPRDIAPSMAVGFTINHIAAVVLPAIGGLLWMVDYRIPFAAGAGLALISLLAAQKIKVG